MRKVLHVICALLAASLPAQAAHTTARLILDHTSVRPGDTFTAGIYLKMDPGWHTYWVNSGASGMPTTIAWELPKGVTAGPVQWPVPEKLPDPELTTYIYKDEVLLLVPLKVDTSAAAGAVQLKAKVSWLECEISCVPGDANVVAALNIGAEQSTSADQAFIEKWRKLLPQPGTSLSAAAWWEGPATGDTRPLILQWTARNAGAPDFYPYASEAFEVQGPTTLLGINDAKVQVRKMVKKLEGAWPAKISGVVIEGEGTAKVGYEISVAVAQSSPTSAPSRTAAPVLPQPGSSWMMFLYAFIGGLILNVMPCVLPVIALKILGFVNQAREDRRRVRKLGLIYTAGVLASFFALAAMVIAVKAAGHRASWGMQFSNPQFLVVLIVLVTLVALNLFGLFEVSPGGRVMGAAGSLASKHGAAGAFFNGVLATVLATPCTAPILGYALGFAFAVDRTPLALIAIFLTVGLGLALPYLLLSWEPRWLKFLPKPGPWMERFKVAMGFPMLGTAIWLFSLVPIHYGDRSWWLGVFLVIVAFAAWVFGEFVQRASSRKGLSVGIAAVILISGYVEVVERRLHWRSPEAASDSFAAASVSPESKLGISWEPWSPDAVNSARAGGRPVLVDFTAKWCVTCNLLVKPVLESQGVRKKLAALDAVALLGDYTRFPAAITEELNRYGRAGVPLVLVYPKNPSAPPFVLPETPTPGMVVEALEKAAR